MPEIEKFANTTYDLNSIDSDLQLIANEYEFNEFFFNSWTNLKTNMDRITHFFQIFEKFVHKKVFIDEVTINEFVENHNSSSILQVIQEILVPADRLQSLLYKLYLAVKIQVSK